MPLFRVLEIFGNRAYSLDLVLRLLGSLVAHHMVISNVFLVETLIAHHVWENIFEVVSGLCQNICHLFLDL